MARMTSARTRARAPLLRSVPDSAADYAAALAKLTALRAQDGEEVNPVCETWSLTHDAKAARAVVLVHGITNCPAQFVKLAPLLFEEGFNVLVPRIPWNGFLDRSGRAMRRLTARDLRAFGDAIVDIGRGLGDRVTVVGLSGGGTVAAWAAQCRPDVERAVVIAPCIGVLARLPFGDVALNRLAMRAMRALPNVMTQRFMPIKAGPPHNYVGFATRGLGATAQLGFAVFDAAKQAPPAARSVVVITNDADPAVNNPITRELARRWRARAGDAVRTYEFAAEHQLIHDIIDPTQQAEQTAFVYPILLDQITAV